MCSRGENSVLCKPSAWLTLRKRTFSPLKVIVLTPGNGHFAPENGHFKTKRSVEARHLTANLFSIAYESP